MCNDDIDAFRAFLVEHGEQVLDRPCDYPEYGQGYNALFFADPDGIKLELVHCPWGYWRDVLLERVGRAPEARAGCGDLKGSSRARSPATSMMWAWCSKQSNRGAGEQRVVEECGSSCGRDYVPGSAFEILCSGSGPANP